MPRRDIGTDDPRVHVRPGKASRPRTKQRPSYSEALIGMVTRIDRGHYRIHLCAGAGSPDQNPNITAVKARELGRGKVVVGDRVGVVGDTSGRKDTLARMVRVEARRTLLLRSSEDGDNAGTQKPIVANADLLVIVTAAADPTPRPRLIDRYLVAAYDAGLEPILVLTKVDLADPRPLLSLYEPLGLQCITTALKPHFSQPNPGLATLAKRLSGHSTVFVGHSGVGKSTLINALVPGAQRSTGAVNAVTGRGRHTSTNLQALQLPAGGWVIDTPGVRSFGIAHVSSENILRGFSDLNEVAKKCPRGCKHTQAESECALDEWIAQADTTKNPAFPQAASQQEKRRARVESFRRLLSPIQH